MKTFTKYTVADWLHLRPLTQGYKTLRYALVDRAYRQKPARVGDLQAVQHLLKGRKVLITIAYGDAEAIAWQVKLIRHYVPHALHIIADNSPADASAMAIQVTAQANNASYLRLPVNPWPNGSRSHGVALNWLWHNLIHPGAPAQFGFLDHDLFPTAPDDPFAALAGQDFYGVVREAEERWFLWAGFCFYNFAGVKDKKLDFGQDWFNGLDTGGGNWRPLYQFANRASLRESLTEFRPFKSGVSVADGPVQWCGAWLHEVGTMGRPDLASEKRRYIAALLASHLMAAHQ